MDDAQSDNNGVERQTIKATYRNKSIKGLSDRRPRRLSDLFATDPTPKWWVLAFLRISSIYLCRCLKSNLSPCAHASSTSASGFGRTFECFNRTEHLVNRCRVVRSFGSSCRFTDCRDRCVLLLSLDAARIFGQLNRKNIVGVYLNHSGDAK